ncbi:tetratricopeptide repeat-containing sensor histidine kinase [Penaeicola halotolerans]|uniref:tetratricopeptide repeat-containing sensor histidine kinase n=1 Tax=Penaeicola halotolerans TaxID=2793196 RepID=UPI001CF8EC28|nr:sensor histidine kinase [Penaeicola halotolerans]
MKKITYLIFIITLVIFSPSYSQTAPDANSILQIIDKIPDYKTKVEKLSKGLDSLYLSSFDLTISLSKYGLTLSQNQSDSLNIANFLRLIGLSYGKKGNIDSASVYYYKALETLNNYPYSNVTGLLYDDMARMYRKLRQPQRALEFYEKALELYQKTENQEGIARIYNESGVVYRDEGDYEEANDRFTKSLEIQTIRNDSVGMGYSLEFLGYNQLLLKNYKQSEEYLKRALEIREAIGETFAIMLNYTALGEFYKETKQYEASNLFFNKSNTLAQSIHFLDIQQYNHQQIISNYEALGDYQNALSSYKLYTLLKDSLYNIQKIKDVEDISAKYETAKKESQIKTQQIELESAKHEKFLYILILLIAIALLALFIFLIIYRHRHKLQWLLKTQNEQALIKIIEAEENERERIAKELHDGVVQELVVLKQKLYPNEVGYTDAKVQSLEGDVSQIMEDVRNIAYQMMPVTLKSLGLVKALDTLLDKTLSQSDIEYDFDCVSEELKLDERTEINLYRVCQELIHNTIKHSGATRMSLLLLPQKNLLTINYEDDGKGFDPAAVNKGIGLNSIYSRVKLLNGSITFEETAGNGINVYIKIPLTQIK